MRTLNDVPRRLVIAIGGILSVVAGGLSVDVPLRSLLALLAGGAFLAEGAVVYKLFPRSHPMATNAVGFTVSAALLLGLSLLVGEQWALPTMARIGRDI